MTERKSDAGTPVETEKPHEEEAPTPIAKALIVIYISTLFLVILVQMISMYNKDKLSVTISSYTEDHESIRNLSMALLEIENANAEIRDWVLADNPSNEFNAPNFSLHLSSAKESLELCRSVPQKYQGLRETILAAMQDLENRNLLVNQAMQEKKLESARIAARDRRTIAVAMNALSQNLRESKHDVAMLQQKLHEDMRILDTSLTMIMTAMIIASIFLAFLWSRLVALH